MEIPTGEGDERDSVGTLPQPLQLGSGAVDVIAGGAYTFQTLALGKYIKLAPMKKLKSLPVTAILQIMEIMAPLFLQAFVLQAL